MEEVSSCHQAKGLHPQHSVSVVIYLFYLYIKHTVMQTVKMYKDSFVLVAGMLKGGSW